MKAAQRNKLPASQFGLAGERKYPVDTPARAANAKARATQMEHRGIISEAQKETIDRKANAKLRRG